MRGKKSPRQKGNAASVFVSGTDTGVGKTVSAAAIIMAYKKAGIDTGFMKPVQSGCGTDGGSRYSQDARFMAASAEAEVGPCNSRYIFLESLSPYMAAHLEGKEISIEKIVEDYETLSAGHQALVVEGAGGLFAPVTKDRFVIDLAVGLDLPLVLVARSNLGTLNHAMLSVRAARERGLTVLGLIINRFLEGEDRSVATNLVELTRVTGLPILAVIPELEGLSVEAAEIGSLKEFVDGLDIDDFLAGFFRSTPDNPSLAEDDLKFIWHPFTQMSEYEKEDPRPPVIEKGEGSYLIDTYGNRYLDGVSSLWVNVHGHRNRRLDEALIDQVGKISHSTLLGLTNVPAVRLAKKIAGITPAGLEKVFYSDSGSTAVEVALKIAFQYWRQRGGGYRSKTKFISFVNAYHGDTLGSVSAGGIDLFHKIYEPLLFDVKKTPSAYCYRCPKDLEIASCDIACIDDLEELLKTESDQTAAVIVEPKVQGAAGMLISPPGYLTRIRELTRKYDVLLIADEVATAFGRTGKMFACDWEGISPDIICLAKGITGGYLPLAATVATNNIFDAFVGDYEKYKTFFHGHTYTGNPLACAVASANIDLFFQDRVLAGVESKVNLLNRLLNDFRDSTIVGDIRQCGFMVGIELVKDRATREPFDVKERVGRKVILKARSNGVIIRPLGDVIVLMPPLSISERDLEKLTGVTLAAVNEVAGEYRA